MVKMGRREYERSGANWPTSSSSSTSFSSSTSHPLSICCVKRCASYGHANMPDLCSICTAVVIQPLSEGPQLAHVVSASLCHQYSSEQAPGPAAGERPQPVSALCLTIFLSHPPTALQSSSKESLYQFSICSVCSTQTESLCHLRIQLGWRLC